MRQRASRTRTCWEKARAGVSAQSRGDVARSSAQGPGGAACVRQAPAVVGMARWYPEPNSSCSGALLSEVAGKKLGQQPRACHCGAHPGLRLNLTGRLEVIISARVSRPRPAWRTASFLEAALHPLDPPYPGPPSS